MNEIVPFHGIALATTGRLDIRAMTRHYTAPYSAAVPFEDLIEVVRENSTPEVRRCKNRRPGAGLAIRKAVAGRLHAVTDARDRMSVIMLAPDEEDVRRIIGAMLLVFPTPPSETSGFLVDALVLELREPDVGYPFSLPAIAAAARECWQTLPAPPSIAQFLTCVKKHQQRLDDVLQQLCDTLEASYWADDIVEPNKQADEDEWNDAFGPE